MTERIKLMTTSPHVTDNFSTQKIMLHVIIALLPCVIAGTIFFGLYALLMVALSVAACIFGEWLFNVIRKKPKTISDLSCIVTGIILGLNLPPYVPAYVPIIGGLFAIMLVKMLFGGLGKNFANPAATARVFLVLAWTSVMTRFSLPINYATQGFSGFFTGFSSVDITTSATPLGGGSADLLSLFVGNVAGSIGETSAIAILIGGIYLLAVKVINYKIPLIYLTSTMACLFVFGVETSMLLPQILSGGVLFAAFFMATDYSTSPNTVTGTVIYAFMLGFFTALIRVFSSWNEGASLAILFVNLFVPLLDKYIVPKSFGEGVDLVQVITTSIVSAFIVVVAIIATVFGIKSINSSNHTENSFVTNIEVVSNCSYSLDCTGIGGAYEII